MRNKKLHIISMLLCILCIVPALSHAGNWSLDITSVLSSNSQVIKNSLIAGMKPDATNDVDNLWDTKAFSPNTSTSQILFETYFNHPEYSTDNQKLWRDIRGNYASAQWDMIVKSNTNVEVNLHWKFYESDGCYQPIFKLTDNENNTTVNMKSTNNYRFNIDQINNFTISVNPGQNINAPQPPASLWIPIKNDDSIMLVWEKGDDTVNGYNLYRKELPSGNFKKVNSSVLTSNRFLDNIEPGMRYEYAVTAMASCESYMSNPISFNE